MRIKFWGVRGSITCAYPDFLEYGGNTACVEVEVFGRTIIFDAGTGLPWLGNELLKRGVKEMDMLMSHFHNDHTAGFNYFKPIYIPGHTVHLRAAENYGETSIEGMIRRHMQAELHPVQFDNLESDLNCIGFQPGDEFDLHDGIHIKTTMLTHPAGSTAYRLEADGKVFVYATDTEHNPDKPDQGLLALMKDADLVIYDCTYSEDELPQYKGWGHSTWNQGIKLCKLAGAKRMAMFHYSPDHNDTQVRELENQAKATWSGAFGAKEGMEIVL